MVRDVLTEGSGLNELNIDNWGVLLFTVFESVVSLEVVGVTALVVVPVVAEEVGDVIVFVTLVVVVVLVAISVDKVTLTGTFGAVMNGDVNS